MSLRKIYDETKCHNCLKEIEESERYKYYGYVYCKECYDRLLIEDRENWL